MKFVFFLGISCVTLLLFASNANTLGLYSICSRIKRFHDNSNCHKTNFLCPSGQCIDSSRYCDGRSDCGDDADEKYCYMLGKSCPKKPSMRKCPGKEKCILDEWFCDGLQRHCDDGKDEQFCDNVIRYDPDQSRASSKAVQWLNTQKNSQSATEKWGPFVDKSAVVIHLSNFQMYGYKNAMKEMAFETSIQLLTRLSKRKLQDIPSSDLASYLNAFLVTCVDPRKFHGLDIVQELRSRVDSHNHTNPYLLLSLCNAGDTITQSDVKKLIDAFRNKHRAFWTDTQAVSIMALACANQQPGKYVDSRTMRELLLELKQHQYRNGTVENLQTTALVMQALFSAETFADPDNFDETQAMQQMLAMQKPDGSFGSFMNTYYVLPVLSCKSLVNISSDHCESSTKDEISALDDLTNRSEPKIHVRYYIWIGNEKDLEIHLTLRVPANMSFYGIMEMAAEIDSRYRFEYVVKNLKPYVNVLSGLPDDPEKGKFWFLYTVVDGKPTPSQESPVDVMPKKHDHFVMWYQSGSWII